MKRGQMRLVYVCVSKTCGHSVELNIPNGNGINLNLRPVCGCGADMKKAYSTPVLFRLSKTEISQPEGQSTESNKLPETGSGE